MINFVIDIALKDLLVKQDKSLYKLAKETGISYNALWKISNKKVSGITFDVMDKICHSLKCTPDELLSYKK